MFSTRVVDEGRVESSPERSILLCCMFGTEGVDGVDGVAVNDGPAIGEGAASTAGPAISTAIAHEHNASTINPADKNLHISINTDDIGVFDTSLENEYALLFCCNKRRTTQAGNTE